MAKLAGNLTREEFANVDAESVADAKKRRDAYIYRGIFDFRDMRLRRSAHERKLALREILSFSFSLDSSAKLYFHTLHVHGASVFPNQTGSIYNNISKRLNIQGFHI